MSVAYTLSQQRLLITPMFYCDEEKTKTKDNDNEKIGQRIDHGYVNENLSPKGIKEQVMDETKIIDQEDDDYYYDIDLSSKRTTAGQTTVDM